MKIVILGSSAAGAKIIEEIRRSDPESEITIIAFDGHYPNNRESYAAFIGKEIVPENVFYRPKNFYDQNKVTIHFDKKISRINVKRKKIFTEDKGQIDYDVLVVTDTPENRFPEIKGITKENVFGFTKLKDIDTIVNTLPVVKTVVIQSDSFSGLQAAAALLKREKEVILVPPGENFMIGYFDTGTMAWLQEKFAETGLRVLTDNPIKEVLGDKEAKAVRLKTGKIFSAEIILFMETGEDLRLFSDSGIPMGRAIEVDEDFRAGGVDNVFAVDRPGGWGEGDPVTPLAVLEEQAQKVAAVIRGKEHQFILPVLKRSVSVGGITITLLGQTQERDGVMVKQVFTPESGKYQRLFIEQGCLVGAVLVNREEDKEDLLRRIDAREHFEWQDDVPQNGNSTGTGVYSAAGTENVSTELVDN